MIKRNLSGNIKIKILTKGHIRPRGISGSGIIDIVSELLKEKIIKNNGRMKKASFVVYEDKKRRIELTQFDVDKILRSKAAVHTAIAILMRRSKTSFSQISKVMLSGNLGDYLSAENVARIGLVPGQLKEKIKFTRNAALEGVKLALLQKSQLKKIIKLAENVRHLPLKKDRDFKNSYKKALKFPG